MNGSTSSADGLPSVPIGTVPWPAEALLLTVLASHVLLRVSGGSKCGLDACSVQVDPSPNAVPEDFSAWQAMPTRVSQHRTGIERAL